LGTRSNTIVDITIESLGGLGDGIGRLDGKPVFVPKSCVGDRLKIRVVHQNHDGFQATITEIIKPGIGRAVPPCPHFSQCGGCTLQQLAPPDYHAFKTRMLHSALIQAGFPLPNAKVTFLPAATRRRVEFKVTPDGKLGLLPLRRHMPIPIDQCLVLEPRLQALIAPINEALAGMETENIKSISLTAVDSGVDMVVTYFTPPLEGGAGGGVLSANVGVKVTPHPNPPPQGGRELCVPGIARITARLPDGTLQTLMQTAPVEMHLGNHTIILPPDAFLQATQEGQNLLTRAAMEATKSATFVVDLFCGIGTYSLPLSTFTKVHAVEIDGSMVQNLKRHAIPNITAEQRDLFKNPLSANELNRFQAAILNPPRLGAKAQTEQLAQSNIHTIVMISCNPATFARDAKILGKAGFRLESAQGIDQFVWSGHLEIVAVFKR